MKKLTNMNKRTLYKESKGSVNEADVVGKTVFSDGKGKLHFGYYKTDDAVEFVDYKTWKKLSFKDVSKGDTNKDRVVNAILKNQKQFNKKVDYNMWAKKTNPSFEQKMDWFIQNGWISNITKGGIRESIESVNEASMSDIDIIAQEAKDFKDFVKEFYKEYKDFAKTKEALKWLEGIYKNRSKMEGLERVADALPQTEEEPISENSLSDLEKKLKSHDWWFAYSDDGSKYRRGSDNWNELTSMLKSLKGPQAEKLFNKYVPDGFSPTYKKLVESNSTPMNEDLRMGFRHIIHLIPTGYAPNDPKYKFELRYLINTLNNFYKERGYDRKILSIY